MSFFSTIVTERICLGHTMILAEEPSKFFAQGKMAAILM